MEYTAQQNNVAANQVDKKFVGLAEQLRQTWIGSDKNLMEICESFRRPYLMGYNSEKPRNAIMLIGSESHGKVKAITEISELLKQRKVLRYSAIAQMDLKNYPTTAILLYWMIFKRQMWKD